MAEIKYDIIESIGLISTSKSNWTKEINLISWNDREPKYDIRDWDPDHEKMKKGITLTKEELISLKKILNAMDI